MHFWGIDFKWERGLFLKTKEDIKNVIIDRGWFIFHCLQAIKYVIHGVPIFFHSLAYSSKLNSNQSLSTVALHNGRIIGFKDDPFHV